MKINKSVYFYLKNYSYSEGRIAIIDLYKFFFKQIGFKVCFTEKILKKKIYVFFDEYYSDENLKLFQKVNKNNFTILILTEYFSKKNYNSYNLFNKISFFKILLVKLFSIDRFANYYKILNKKLKIIFISILLSFPLLKTSIFLVLIFTLCIIFLFNKYLYSDIKEKNYFKKRYASIKYLILHSNLVSSNFLIRQTMKKNNKLIYNQIKKKYLSFHWIFGSKIKKKHSPSRFDFVGDFNQYRKKILFRLYNSNNFFSEEEKRKVLNKIKLPIHKRYIPVSKYLIYIPKDISNPYISDTAINLSIKSNCIPLVFDNGKLYKKGIYKYFFTFKTSKDLNNFEKNYKKFFKIFSNYLNKIYKINKIEQQNFKINFFNLLKKNN